MDPIYVLMIMLVGHTWEIILNPITGYLISLTKTRFGRLRPWYKQSIVWQCVHVQLGEKFLRPGTFRNAKHLLPPKVAIYNFLSLQAVVVHVACCHLLLSAVVCGAIGCRATVWQDPLLLGLLSRPPLLSHSQWPLSLVSDLPFPPLSGFYGQNSTHITVYTLPPLIACNLLPCT